MRRRGGRRDDDMGLNSLARNSRLNGYRGRTTRGRPAMAWAGPGRFQAFKGGRGEGQGTPFYGFPGGYESWERFRQTGEQPAGASLTPAQVDWYSKRPVPGQGQPPGMPGPTPITEGPISATPTTYTSIVEGPISATPPPEHRRRL